MSAVARHALGEVASCPLCSGSMRAVLHLHGEPVLSNRLWPDRPSALRAPRGRIDLAFCDRCGAGRNLAFEPASISYDDGYESSLHASATFSAYADRLAADLVRRHGLAGRRLLELGAGSAQFLRALCRHGGPGTLGVAVDPSYRGSLRSHGPISFVPSLRPAVAGVEFLCARHVLEHLDDPVSVLRRCRSTGPADRSLVAYVEVPDAGYMLRTAGIWDVLYEHVWYFTDGSLRRLLAAAGFEVRASGSAFGGQYLWAEAVSAPRAPSTADGPLGIHDGVHPETDLARDARRFGDRGRRMIEQWSDEVGRRLARGERLALWGAGSKGVSFLTRVRGAQHLGQVVDANPRKHGRHLPVSGHRVLAPAAVAVAPPDAVILANGIYRDEVRAELARLGQSPELLALVSGDAVAPTSVA